MTPLEFIALAYLLYSVLRPRNFSLRRPLMTILGANPKGYTIAPRYKDEQGRCSAWRPVIDCRRHLVPGDIMRMSKEKAKKVAGHYNRHK